MNRIATSFFRSVVLITGVSWFSGVLAQQSLEEVLVTATLKEQSELDTPISISILEGDVMLENNIMNMFDISDRTPAVHISKGTFSNKIYMRGVGSGQNAGFDQSVGQFVDGVYQGRSWTTPGTLMDMERIEILKGPQTTYFGNNSIGGAFSFITNVPTNEKELSISGSVGNHGERTLTVIGSGPLSESVKGRLAITYHAMDGWLENTNPRGDDYPDKDGFNARATFVWDASDNTEVKLKTDFGRLDTGSGLGWQQVNCNSTSNLAGPLNACALALALPNFEGSFNDRFSASENADGHLDSDQVVLTIKTALGTHELTSITAYQSFDSKLPGESDMSARDHYHWLHAEESDQFSQELRLTSLASDKLQYTLGLYYQTTDVENDLNLALYFVPEHAPAVAGDSRVALVRPFDQTTDSKSIFATLTLFVTDKLHITPGVRWTDVEKETDRGNYVGSHTFDGFNMNFGFSGTPASDTFEDDELLPSLMIQYFKDEKSMIYASYSDGFKSGGFEYLASNTEKRGRYESEGVDALELGYKTSTERMKLSIAYFHTEYDGNQLSSYLYPSNATDFGTTGYLTTANIPSTSKGFELEISYLLSDTLRADLSFTKLDATYDSYVEGICAAGVSPPAGRTGCDHSGKQMLYAPDYSGLFTLSDDRQISGGLNLKTSISVYFTDDVWHNGDYASFNQQESYEKIDVRIELSKDNWYLAFLGKNLTDEYTSNWNQQVGFVPGGNFSVLDRTRSYAAQFGYDF